MSHFFRKCRCQALVSLFAGFWGLGGVPSIAADDIYDYGEYLSAECVACHRTDETASDIPAIVGWPESRFVEALKSYQSGEREHQIMQNVARSLGEEEMAALAKFYRKLDEEGE